MLDSTFHVIATNPVVVPPAAVAVWLLYKRVNAVPPRLVSAVVTVAAFATGTLFVTQFLAEFFGTPFWRGVAEDVVAFEASAVLFLFHLLDSLLAAGLRSILFAIAGGWYVVGEFASSAVPAVTAHEFLVSVFGFELFAGALFVSALTMTADRTKLSQLVRAAGVVMLISGLLVVFVQLEQWQAVNQSVLLSAFVAGMTGFACGVAAPILLVEPNFGDRRVRDEVDEPASERDRTQTARDTGLVGRVRSRVRKLFTDEE